MKEYNPEIGQALFGQPHKQYKVSNLLEAALREIASELERVIYNITQKPFSNPFENTGAKWKCDEFEVEAYDWNEDNIQLFNFKWKDVEISWYKYLGRGMSCNKYVQPNEISIMLDSCLKAIHDYESKHGLKL